MALQKKTSNSSRLTVIFVTIAIVGVVGFVLFQQFYINQDEAVNTNATIDRTSRVIKTFGEDILQDPRYRALVDYGREPVEPIGSNPNPFQ